MARPKTRSNTDIYRERDQKYYDFKKIKIRKEWGFIEKIKQAAEITGESANMFIIRACVERARALGIPFENGPFFDEEASEPENDDE